VAFSGAPIQFLTIGTMHNASDVKKCDEINFEDAFLAMGSLIILYFFVVLLFL
jgi:hypothetical protein